MTYKAIACRIRVRPLLGADKLQIGACGNYQVVVGIDVADGELGVFFEADGQLSEDFAARNDLVRRKLEDGTSAGGMFEQNRRVKAIKLRGVKSEGFWCPIRHFEYTGVTIGEGDQFSELGGHQICNKYFTPATQRAGASRNGPQRDNAMFHKHIDTGHFRREAGAIPIGSLVIVTEKLHGTSQRIGHVLDDEPIEQTLTQRLGQWLLGWQSTRKVWRHLVGTRNVILEHRDDPVYTNMDYRHDAVDGVALHKGEVVYGEVVGYEHTGKPIMATQNAASMRDKAIKAKYGDTITYSYGCDPGKCRFFVYRITQVNEDGIATELSWSQVKKRCRELGLDHVPELGQWDVRYDSHRELLAAEVANETERSDGFPLESTLCPSHIREGVVVRYESEHGTGWLKNKAFVFNVLEGNAKESDDFVDAEESA